MLSNIKAAFAFYRAGHRAELEGWLAQHAVRLGQDAEVTMTALRRPGADLTTDEHTAALRFVLAVPDSPPDKRDANDGTLQRALARGVHVRVCRILRAAQEYARKALGSGPRKRIKYHVAVNPAAGAQPPTQDAQVVRRAMFREFWVACGLRENHKVAGGDCGTKGDCLIDPGPVRKKRTDLVSFHLCAL